MVASARPYNAADRRSLTAAARADIGPQPPGAKLDGFRWAASWGSYLAAIRTSRRFGARAAIRQVMTDSRPRNAMSERVGSEGSFWFQST